MSPFHFPCLKYLAYNLAPFFIPVHSHVSFSPDISISFLHLLLNDYLTIETTHFFISRLFRNGRLQTTSLLTLHTFSFPAFSDMEDYRLSTPFHFPTRKTPHYLIIDTTHLFVSRLFWHGRRHSTLPLTLHSFSFPAFCDPEHLGEPHYWLVFLPVLFLLRISFSLLPDIIISCFILFSFVKSHACTPNICRGHWG